MLDEHQTFMAIDHPYILTLSNPDRQELIRLLQVVGSEQEMFYRHAAVIKNQHIGNKVFLRGLVEYSNVCSKNCYYCGVRRGNRSILRYTLSDEEVLDVVRLVMEKQFGSMVIQSGERSDRAFVNKVAGLLEKIHDLSDGSIRVTLSMGEQTKETYRTWYKSGAQRYLLRIETSNRELYKKLHPQDSSHDYDRRIQAIEALKDTGFQVGTGVMIGLPFQTYDDLAGDLLFIRDHEIDMVGMGPYIEHSSTPLYKYRGQLLPKDQRFELSMKMVALLRILMPDINIAATTAMQTLNPRGREIALGIGANVIMPNLTPLKYRESYLLYDNKPSLHEETEESLRKLRASIEAAGCVIALDEWGDSKHFVKRTDSRL